MGSNGTNWDVTKLCKNSNSKARLRTCFKCHEIADIIVVSQVVKVVVPVQLLLSDTKPQGGEKPQQQYNNQSVSALDMVKEDCHAVFNDSEFTEIVTELQEVLNR